MTWQRIGEITVTPDTMEPVTIGPVRIPPFNGIEVKVTQKSPQTNFPYGYGLLWVENTNGRELGTIKVWGHVEGECYRLGAGLSSLLGGGLLKFAARAYNLRWVKSNGVPWELEFFAATTGQLPEDRYRADGFQTSGGNPLPVVSVNGFGRLRF